MIELLGKIWRFLNGKKTIIGIILFLVATVLEEVLGDIWGVTFPVLDQVIATMQYVAKPLGAVGIGHKLMKGQ